MIRNASSGVRHGPRAPTRCRSAPAAVCAAFLLLCGCQDDASAPLQRVFLITFDTLRADHVSSHGYPRRTTPFLDRLAERGVHFENAYASMPTTAPAHASTLCRCVC